MSSNKIYEIKVIDFPLKRGDDKTKRFKISVKDSVTGVVTRKDFTTSTVVLTAKKAGSANAEFKLTATFAKSVASEPEQDIVVVDFSPTETAIAQILLYDMQETTSGNKKYTFVEGVINITDDINKA